MYDNISGKIKGLAKGIFIFLSVVSVIVGLTLMCISEDLILYGLLCAVLGSLFSWVSSWVLYGFGELIEKVSAIEKNTRGTTTSAPVERKLEEATTTVPVVENVVTVKTVEPEAKAEPVIGPIKKCEFCGQLNVPGKHCRLEDDFGVRFRDLCLECIEDNQGDITEMS